MKKTTFYPVLVDCVVKCGFSRWLVGRVWLYKLKKKVVSDLIIKTFFSFLWSNMHQSFTIRKQMAPICFFANFKSPVLNIRQFHFCIVSSVLHHRADEMLVHPTKAFGYTSSSQMCRCLLLQKMMINSISL